MFGIVLRLKVINTLPSIEHGHDCMTVFKDIFLTVRTKNTCYLERVGGRKVN